ncbi:MAG: hypothetical protein R3E12_00460 [Candidatus Eisenbacteria bacterium]
MEIHLRLAAQSAVAHDLAHIAQLMAAAARWRDAAFVRFLARRFQERDAVAFEPGAETGLADLESRLAEALSETERLRCRASALALSRDELAEAVLPLLVSESPRTPDQGSTGKM